MKTRISFEDAFSMINTAADMAEKNGYYTGRMFLEYLICKTFGEMDFDGRDDVIELHNEGILADSYKEVLKFLDDKRDDKQFYNIWRDWERQVEQRNRENNAKAVLGDISNTVSRVADYVIEKLEKITETNIDTETVNNFIQAVNGIKDNINAKDLATALIDSGVITSEKS